MEFKRYYNYEGPVVAFGKVIANRWRAETIATSRTKALNNLAYKFKQDAKLLPSARVNLVDKYLKEGDFTS
jgi:hypothetical protein